MSASCRLSVTSPLSRDLLLFGPPRRQLHEVALSIESEIEGIIVPEVFVCRLELTMGFRLHLSFPKAASGKRFKGLSVDLDLDQFAKTAYRTCLTKDRPRDFTHVDITARIDCQTVWGDELAWSLAWADVA